MAVFVRGSNVRTTAPALALVAAGVIESGGRLPASVQAGDRIYLLAVSAHDAAAAKTIQPPTLASGPSTLVQRFTAADFIPDLLLCRKTAVAADANAVVTAAGATTPSILYLVVRNDSATVVAGQPATGYFSNGNTVGIAGAPGAQAGVHVVWGTMSGSPTQSPQAVLNAPPAGFTLQGTNCPKYGGGVVITGNARVSSTPDFVWAGPGVQCSVHAVQMIVS